MKPKIKNLTNLTFGPVRLSYAFLFDKSDKSNKYQADLLISKEDKEALIAINECIENAKKIGVEKYWNGKVPEIENPLKDGDKRLHVSFLSKVLFFD